MEGRILNEKLPSLVAEIQKVSDDAESTFGNLSAEQINWKPAAESWSIGQCFDHVIKSNQAFEPELERLLTKDRKHTIWERYSPLTGFFGNFLLKSLKNDTKKYKAPTKDIIPPSEIPAGIIERFIEHQNELSARMKSVGHVDWKNAIVTSPFMRLMTYRLDIALEIGIEHEKRHIRQAKRVLETDGFPAG